VAGMIVFGFLMAISFAGNVQADGRVHEVNWSYPSPGSVSRFVLFVSPVSGALDQSRQIEVGKPGGKKINNIQLFSALVPMDEDEFIAIGAVGHNGVMGPLSAWGQPQPSRPGQPLIVSP
jgi:hypothetical protein